VHKRCTAAVTHGGFVTACVGSVCCGDVCAAARNKCVGDVLGACGASTRAYIRYVFFNDLWQQADGVDDIQI
jgi:hypothetical protein